jgi:GT2 family glycosyltransferase
MNNITVSIVVTFLDWDLVHLPRLVTSLENQSFTDFDLIVVDQSGKNEIDRHLQVHFQKRKWHIIRSVSPKGFAANYNHAIRESCGEYVFVINPDTMLEYQCVERLVNVMILDGTIGCISPKIFRLIPESDNNTSNIIDSTGVILRRNIRHFDRGAGETDCGQYEKKVFVFGFTGAGVFFRRSCLNDVRIDTQYFDEDFWSYREDADLSWRIQNYGWNCLYYPQAIMYHVRRSKPRKRSNNSKLVNMHSVKNRYLLMINNLSLMVFLRNLPYIMFREVVVFFGVLFTEPYSFQAYFLVLRDLPRFLRKRKTLQNRAKCDSSAYWFANSQKEYKSDLYF